MYNDKTTPTHFSRPYFSCVIINELVMGSTTNSPYLGQTLTLMALSSHCVEESPTSITPSHLSQWFRAAKRARAWEAEETSKEELPR